MNFYGDLRIPRTKIIEKKVVLKRKKILGFFRISNCPKINFGLNKQFERLYHFNKIFSEKVRQIIKKFIILAFIWSKNK